MRGGMNRMDGLSWRQFVAPIAPFLLFDPMNADAVRGIVPNEAAATALDTTEVLNVIKGRAFRFGPNGATATYAAANGPEGAATAHRVAFAGGGGVGRFSVEGVRLTAGTYTLYADFKTADGAPSYTVRWGHSAAPDAITVTDAWQTFSQTITVGTGTIGVYVPVKDASNNAYDVLVDNVRVSTQAAHAEATPGGHLRFGISTASSGNPTFSGNTIVVGDVQGVIRYPSKTITEFTIMYAFSQNASISGAVSFWPGIAEGYPSLAFGPSEGVNSGSGISIQKSGGSAASTSYAGIKDRGWFICGCRVQDGLQEVFINNCILGRTTTSFPGVTSSAMIVNNTGNFPLPADFYVVANQLPGAMGPFFMFDRLLTPAECAEAADDIRTRLEAGGNNLASNPYWLLAAGDSITADDATVGVDGTGSYARRVLFDNVATVGGAVFAAGGNTLAEMDDRLDWQLPWIEQSVLAGNDVICSLLAGANGVLTADPEDFFDDLVAYYARVRAAGGKALACTVLPQNNSTFNTNRAAINTLLRNNPSVYDGLCDFDTVLEDADAADTDIFTDGTHLTGEGYDIITPVFQDAFDALVASL